MDSSPGGAGREPPPWHSSLSPRQPMYGFGSSPPSSATNAAEAPPSTRSPTTPSRRRRVLGRLVRSGSDSRSASPWTPQPEAQELIPDASTTRPFKRKAHTPPKASKSAQRRSSMDHMSISNFDPPLIRSEDVLPPIQTAASPGVSTAMRGLFESSDSELDNFDLVMQANVLGRDRTSRRFSTDFRQHIRVAEEGRRRNDTTRVLSAVLVTPDNPAVDLSFPHTVSERLRYLPLCPSNITMSRTESGNSNFLTVLPSHCDFVQRLQRTEEQSCVIWPNGTLPVELFDLITAHLARDDVKAMRLVNREFEQKVSRSLFHTAVVPFNTEIYDMIDEERKTNIRSSPSMTRPKGKMKALSLSFDRPGSMLDVGGLQWENAKEDKEGKVYRGHGLRVFRGFGPHIKHFGMSFEISEKQLLRPPIKKELDHIEAYHGSYDWPSENYARFATLAGLENTADETSRMKAAFSNLEIVQELALSVDSGLGWLNGPDKSLRATILDQPTPVFGRSYSVPDHATAAASDFWTALQQSQAAFDPHSNRKEVTLEYRPSLGNPTELEGLRDNIYSNVQLWSTLDSSRVNSIMTNQFAGFGIFYSMTGQQRSEDSVKFPLMPGNLSKEQKEWLLETQWAQQAFLESYTLAVIDNPATFSNVSTLNFANVSSRFLPMLSQEVFWDRLPQLSEVILRVNADWRTVDKDEAGFARTRDKFPSDAVRTFHRDILLERISPRHSIKKLTIGWIGGGEHAEGMFARNNNVLPTPLTRVDHCTANSTIFGAVFDHVEHLTLSNCWISPPTLEGLIKSHAHKALEKLTLDSVSLIAHPKLPPANMPAVGAAVAAAMVHPMAAPAPQIPPPPPLPPPNAVNITQWHHQMAQWQQQVQMLQQMQHLPPPQMPANFMQGGNPAAVNVVPAAQNAAQNTAPNPTSPSHWTGGHREGSWPDIIDLISPGVVFNNYRPAPQPWDDPLPPRPETNLRTIEFKSCGYAKLPNHTGFEQSVIEVRPRFHSSHWFHSRLSSLKSSMMTTTDRNIGHIVQHMPQRELDALQFAWGLREGWRDRSKAAEAEYDGFAPGGTGRFSGVIEKETPLVGL